MKTMQRLVGASVIAIAMLAGGGVTIAQQSGLRSIGDLGAAQLVEVRDKAGQVLLHGTLTTSENTPKETERNADLASPSGQGAKGEIEIEIERKDGVVTKNEIELEAEKLPAMLDCEVFLDGNSIGRFVTSKKGKGEFKLNWK
jgi:hypothetical protein